MQLKFLLVTALLGAAPVMAQQACKFSRGCTIGTSQCPKGCTRTESCTKTATKTTTKTATETTTKTLTASISTITKTTTKTVTIFSSVSGTLSASTTTVTEVDTITPTPSASSITITESASTITVTASTSSTAPPQCATEVPYANLFAFPDTKCKNATNFVLGVPLTIGGLVNPPVKFNTLITNPETKYNESSCITLPAAVDVANSIYFTLDGYPKDGSNPSCTMNMYMDKQCKGIDGQGTPDERFAKTKADQCLAVGTNAGKSTGPWNSAQFKCAFGTDLCTAAEIEFGLCDKY